MIAEIIESAVWGSMLTEEVIFQGKVLKAIVEIGAADSAKKKSLGKGTYLEADNLVDFIVPNYDRKKSNYKHTFKKSSEGNWYWVSSEPIQSGK